MIAAAGGVVLSEGNRRTLRQADLVVWLRASPAELARRVAPTVAAGHRPLLEHDPAGTLERLELDRRGLYEGVAELTVDTEGAPIDAIVDAITDAIAEAAEAASP